MSLFLIWFKVKVKSLNLVQLFATPWTVAYQAPSSMGFSRQGYWSRLPFPSPGESSWPRDRTKVSCFAGRRFTVWATREGLVKEKKALNFKDWEARIGCLEYGAGTLDSGMVSEPLYYVQFLLVNNSAESIQSEVYLLYVGFQKLQVEWMSGQCIG